jgi:hypothetical protein
MGICSRLASLSCGFEADGANEGIEIIDNDTGDQVAIAFGFEAVRLL